MFTSEEIERYKRHLVLKDVGGQGQQKIKAARVLVIGAGGLASPVLLYLAAAGVGCLGIIDDDQVSLDNLQRQIIHETSNVGITKVESAKKSLQRLNPYVRVETYKERFNAMNALKILENYDIIVDGSDNFQTRYLVSDACYFAKKPLVFAAVGAFDGYLSVFQPYKKLEDGTPYPSYRCLFPEPPRQGLVENCSEVGILGAVVGVLGSLQAVEVLKLITEVGQTLAGYLLIFDAKEGRFEKVKIPWDPENILSGRSPTIMDISNHENTNASDAQCAIT